VSADFLFRELAFTGAWSRRRRPRTSRHGEHAEGDREAADNVDGGDAEDLRRVAGRLVEVLALDLHHAAEDDDARSASSS